MGNKEIQQLYISLLKKVLIGLNHIDKDVYLPVRKLSENLFECEKTLQDPLKRTEGKDWPVFAESMIGLKRMDNVEYCVKDVLQNDIKGDFIETGVWKGGTCIFMRALLKAYEITDRNVWVADSFQGLPRPQEDLYPDDAGDAHHSFKELSISEESVKNNFKKYDLLDDQVKFLKGWFKDTMPRNSIEKLAILRLDGDMYESTIDVLIYLYPQLSQGGYCIIDDWGAIAACKKAVEDYRLVFSLEEKIEAIDWTGAFWKKEKEVEPIDRDTFFKILTEKRQIVHQHKLSKFNSLPLLFNVGGVGFLSPVFKTINISNAEKEEDAFCFSATTGDPRIHLPALPGAFDSGLSVKVDIFSEKNTKAQIFYQTTDDNKFSEQKSQKQILVKGRQFIFFNLTEKNLNGIMRFDPGCERGHYKIYHLEIRHGIIS